MINPLTVKKLMDTRRDFSGNHPEFFAFAREVFGSDIKAGTEIRLSVAKPGEQPVATTITVQESDLKFIQSLKDLL